jgi:hypothetical protein
MPIQKNFVILGVNHKVQGDLERPGTFEDPDYLDLLTVIIQTNNIDFVGEEGTSNPTYAQKIAKELLGEGHHQNVDPLVGAEREALGIESTGRMLSFQNPLGNEYGVWCEVVAEQEKREEIWVDRLIEKTAVSGLLICGHLHTLSVAFRLRDRGFEVNARVYLPLNKLCGHQERTGKFGR